MQKIISFLFISFLYSSAWAQCGPNEEQYTVEINSTSNHQNIYWTIQTPSNKLAGFDYNIDQNNYTSNVCLSYKDFNNYSFHLKQMQNTSWSGTYAIKNSNGTSILNGNSTTGLNGASFILGPFPCQAIDISVDYSVDDNGTTTVLNDGDIITTCYSIDLEATINFPENNTSYLQENATSNYEWKLTNLVGDMNGQTYPDLNTTIELSDNVEYLVELTYTDINDCLQTFSFFLINISPNTFINVSVDDESLCEGQTTNVHVNYTNTSVPLSVNEPDPVFLDDTPTTGDTAEYVSTITITDFLPTDTLTENCISKVCARLEHSYIGDISIFLLLPNGDKIDFLTDDNGTGSGNGLAGQYLGEPVDNDNSNPQQGTPYKYCWTPAATTTLANVASSLNSGESVSASVETVNGITNPYADVTTYGNTFENATGSPLNGDWTMVIQDYLNVDNGFIFGWDFELCVSPQVTYYDSTWYSDPVTGVFTSNLDEDFPDREVTGILNAPTDNVLTVGYEMEDNFGCVWTDEVEIEIWENPVPNPNTTVFCDNTFDIGVTLPEGMPAGEWSYTVPPGAIDQVIFIPNNTDDTVTVIVPQIGIYDFIYTSFCGSTVTQTVNFTEKEPILNIEDTVVCGFDINLSETGNLQPGVWTVVGPEGETVVIDNPNAFDALATVSNYGVYSFTFTYEWCDASYTKDVVFIQEDPIITTTTTKVLCDLSVDLSAEVEGQEGSWTGSGEGIINFTNFTSKNTSATVSEYGTYTFIYSGCAGLDSIHVTFERVKPNINAPQFIECASQAIIEASWHGYNATINPSVANWKVIKSPIGSYPQLEDNTNTSKLLTVDQNGKYTVEIESCGEKDEVTLVFTCPLEIPNAFSPNQDGKNDHFIIKRLIKDVYSKSEFTVFNRWGNRVYHNADYGLNNSWWDGKDFKGETLEEGAYFYELKLYNKAKENQEIHKGTISLFTNH